MIKVRHGVNFINVLQAAFTHTDPKSTKKTVKLSVYFVLLGSERTKAAHRMLMKLTTGICFTNCPSDHCLHCSVSPTKLGQNLPVNSNNCEIPCGFQGGSAPPSFELESPLELCLFIIERTTIICGQLGYISTFFWTLTVNAAKSWFGFHGGYWYPQWAAICAVVCQKEQRKSTFKKSCS